MLHVFPFQKKVIILYTVSTWNLAKKNEISISEMSLCKIKNSLYKHIFIFHFVTHIFYSTAAFMCALQLLSSSYLNSGIHFRLFLQCMNENRSQIEITVF